MLGYAAHRHAFNRLIWATGSPKWAFDDATYDRSARAFDNPDHVAIVVHNSDGAAASGRGYAKRFSGWYAHRILDGIGHNVPQEAPQAFADAVIDVDRG